MGLFHKTLTDAQVALRDGKMNLFSAIIEKHLRDEWELHSNMKKLMQLLDNYEQALRNAASIAKKGMEYKNQCNYDLRCAKDAIEAFEKIVKEKIEREAKSIK